VPLQIIGGYAQEYMRPHAIGPAVMDGPHLQIDALERAEGALGVGELLVGPDGRGRLAASASICALSRSKENSSSVMVRTKCLAIL
jgi:hypothetical protein